MLHLTQATLVQIAINSERSRHLHLPSQTIYFCRTLLVFCSVNDIGIGLVCCVHTYTSANGVCICAVCGGITKHICLQVWKKEFRFSDGCCIGTYSPFFTFFEDFSYFIKRYVILVRYLKQKKKKHLWSKDTAGTALHLLFYRKGTIKGLQIKTALPYKGNTKSWTIA